MSYGSFPTPLDFPDSPLSRVLRQPMITGLFLPISAGGQSPSSHPRTTSWTLDYNAALTRRAEALGLDLVFGVGEWLGKGGYGGATGFHGESLEGTSKIRLPRRGRNEVELVLEMMRVSNGPVGVF